MFDTPIKLAHGIYSGTLDLIYPPFCLVCGDAGEDCLCADCVEKIDIIEPPYCRKCGIPCESFYCSKCRQRQFAFECACSAGTFDGALRTAIHALKYDSHLVMADSLAELMARCFPTTHLANKVDLAIPIPIHRSRVLERGFNQSAQISRTFCKRVSLPLELKVLYKSRGTRHQVDLPHEERASNIEGAFAVKNAGNVAGKNVLLIDDVFTTGSTLNEAAKTLRNAGAASVYAYTLARSL